MVQETDGDVDGPPPDCKPATKVNRGEVIKTIHNAENALFAYDGQPMITGCDTTAGKPTNKI
jgi:hypothetical protein